MITVKDWGPDGIADLCRRAVRIAYRRLKREVLRPEMRRFGILGDTYESYLAGVVVRGIGRNPAILTAPASQILRELSRGVLIQHLRAEQGAA